MAGADAEPMAAVGAERTVAAAMVAVAVVLTAVVDAAQMAAAASSSCSSVAGETGRRRGARSVPRAGSAGEGFHHRVVNGAPHVLDAIVV